ncbi:MAG: hypothetical protein AAGF10_05425 [Verrucomicrobiota bacterium]
MRVAVVHYHFKPGGVTRIVESASAALAPHGVQLVAISGEPYTGKAELKTAVLPDLQYTLDGELPDPKYLKHELVQAAKGVLGGEPDLWHIHNHCLGKNTAMADVVWLLAQEAPLLLQMHDFAEDGRPANYRTIDAGISDWRRLYPHSPRVHSAVLNRRDYGFLAGAGLPEDQLHLLPNPVSVPELHIGQVPAVLGAERLYIYPTRAIRRKNLGEFLLWAALAQDGELYATTLAPANPTARPVYERWVAFAENHHLQAVLALADRVDLSFPEIMAASEAIITTSVAEGFGMAFLEPYLFGKGLLGRNLPDITADFACDSVSLDGLYDRVTVPLEWIGGVEELRNHLAPALSAAYAAYGREVTESAIDAALAAASAGERVDFGRLDEPLQERALERLLELDDPRLEIEPPHCLSQPSELIEANRSAIAAAYNLEQYGQRLYGIYQQLANAPEEAPEALDPARVLDAFLDPARFNLLRT